MADGKRFDDEIIDWPSGFSRGGVDRSRWKFDEDGFAKGTDIATLRAQQEMQEKIVSLHEDLMKAASPSDYNVTVGGVPIDKVKFENK